jgi:integrase
MGREAQPLNVNSMNSKTFKRIAKAAGLPEVLHAYCVRHSHASALLDAGEPAQRVAERLGHSVETLLRIYSHHLAGRERETAATAARVLFGE